MAARLDPLTLQNFLVLMPAYNEARFIGNMVKAVRALGLDILVIDDGSTDGTRQIATEAGGRVLHLERNQGKGAALHAGFHYAQEEGYDAVITMDADGQHDPGEVLEFCDIYNRTGIPVLIGNRMSERKHMPFIRRYTNRLMSHILNRHMSQYIPDTQNGFRLYQTDVISMVSTESPGFAAESEILLKLDSIRIRMGAVPVAARYGRETSSIRPIRDAMLFLRMLRHHLGLRKEHT